jgi:hypothetical protein
MMTHSTTVDHLVIAAETLAQGIDYCEVLLGIRIPKGGSHPRMGTHNHLLYLGGLQYLEIIAIDPSATKPQRSRWFGLDTLKLQERVHTAPFLATFVARIDNIASITAAYPDLGAVHQMHRDALHWEITIPDDGNLLENGAMPSLIQWPDGINPTAAMPDFGFRLNRLEIHHPQPDLLAQQWKKIGLQQDAALLILPCDSIEEPHLVARIATPAGFKTISGKARY